MMHRNKRRRRRAPAHVNSSTAAEQRFLQQAIQSSSNQNKEFTVPDGPVFFPTKEEFQGNPIHYIEKIRPIAEKYGVCKIVPPKGWNPPFGIHPSNRVKFETKQQKIHRLQEGISFGDGLDYTSYQYQQMASQMAKKWKDRHYPDSDLLARHNVEQKEKSYSVPNLERDYWDIVENHSREFVVEYGNDVDTLHHGSGFPLSERGRSIAGTKDPEKVKLPEPEFGTPDYYKETWWNLNNIPCAPDSVLRHVRVGINGINVPWLYYGALFSTFCWHNEDNYLYSINYNHLGAPKLWYGVPGSNDAAEGLEKVFKSYLSMKMRDVPDLLHHITTMFSPRLLRNANVPVYRLVQYEGEFVVTFPRAFHGGFSLGPNVGEAVNFATHDWISYGTDANERYRSFARAAVFSQDRLTCTMANHLEDQKSYTTCQRLLVAMEQIVEEELAKRAQLKIEGVRDVSHLIKLPGNRLDQLDEQSAIYDDKRLCHACKHVCFFSAVACECSQSKVSCLRHSHYMCRCSPRRRYFMIWSKEEELRETLERVRAHCNKLRESTTIQRSAVVKETEENISATPGVERDKDLHKHMQVSTDEYLTAEYIPSYAMAQDGCGSHTPLLVGDDGDTSGMPA